MVVIYSDYHSFAKVWVCTPDLIGAVVHLLRKEVIHPLLPERIPCS